MKYLIVEPASEFGERARCMSPGPASLARTTRDDDAGAPDRVSRWLGTIDHLGLRHAFTPKFSPGWEPMFVTDPGTAGRSWAGNAPLRACPLDLNEEDVRSMITGAVDARPRRWPFTCRQGRANAASQLLPGKVPLCSGPDVETGRPAVPGDDR